MPKPLTLHSAGRGLLLLGAALTLTACGLFSGRDLAEESDAPEEPVAFERVTFADLPGWEADDPSVALEAFRRSCARFATLPDTRRLNGHAIYGTVGDWREVCATATDDAAERAPRTFFESAFVPYAVGAGPDRTGLFTGYYEPQLRGALEPDETYAYPLLGRPDDLVMVDLSRFREDLKGRRIAGRVVEGRLDPYPSRAEILDGALPREDLAIAWVDDPVDAFFLQIQGSGRLLMPDGGVMRVGYAAQNGHPYTAIGRELVRSGAMALEDVTMQSIREWLEANPGPAAEAIMNANASYVFFTELNIEDPALGPLGGQGVPLTPGRSLAVDHTDHAYGAPVWLTTTLPPEIPAEGSEPKPFRRLMIAQDTGGAIRGPVRGDVFFGFGPRAEDLAGRMKQEGRMWVFLPRTLTPPGAMAEAAAP
jgi:membrane-bound lytic murein transglycosylase A